MSSADSTDAHRSPAVTVLIPAFNAGQMLREAVTSILGQTFTDFECLVIDDGSTDGAVDALRDLCDPRLRIVRNPRNLGLIATLNRGIDLARAPLLARMDADDIALPARLERQVAEFAARPKLALLGTWARIIDSEGAVFGFSRTPVAKDAIVGAILRNNTFIHPSVMLRTEVVRQLGGYPSDAVHAEDYALWLKIVAQFEAANIPECLLHYRVHAGQVSQRKMAAQRATARRLQREARQDFKLRGLLVVTEIPRDPSFWDRLTAQPGTLGSDYLSWSTRYWSMGDKRSAAKTALAGLRVAPLSLKLYRSLTPPEVSPRYWWRRLRKRGKI